jgi:hypothetical protein
LRLYCMFFASSITQTMTDWLPLTLTTSKGQSEDFMKTSCNNPILCIGDIDSYGFLVQIFSRVSPKVQEDVCSRQHKLLQGNNHHKRVNKLNNELATVHHQIWTLGSIFRGRIRASYFPTYVHKEFIFSARTCCYNEM